MLEQNVCAWFTRVVRVYFYYKVGEQKTPNANKNHLLIHGKLLSLRISRVEARSLKKWLKNDVGKDPSLLLWDTNKISLWTVKINNFVILSKGYHNNTYKEEYQKHHL